jgi:tetratricopeptide (TPR) repeat protein
MGWIYSVYDWDWTAADASYRRALELEPGHAWALMTFGVQAMAFGRWDEALDATNKAIERDPLQPNYYTNLGLILDAANRDSEAESAYRKSLELDPAGFSRHVDLGRSLLLQGKPEAALAEMLQDKDESWRLAALPLVYHALGQHNESEKALANLKKKYAGELAFQIAEVHAFRGEAGLAFEWLGRAYDQRDGGVSHIKASRMFRKLVKDPRYKAFLRKLRLPV